MKTLLILLALMVTASAQQFTITRPDIFGNRYIHGSSSGVIQRSDIFGSQRFQINGTSGTISAPDIFGNRRVQFNTMPRQSNYYNPYGY